MRDILCPGVYLKSNQKGSLFKFKESGESIIATTIKYNDEAIQPDVYCYLPPFDILYLIYKDSLINYNSSG
jgi:hypothetical protein